MTEVGTEGVTIAFCVVGKDAIWLVVGWLLCDDVTMSDEKTSTVHHIYSFFILICTIGAPFWSVGFPG